MSSRPFIRASGDFQLTCSGEMMLKPKITEPNKPSALVFETPPDPVTGKCKCVSLTIPDTLPDTESYEIILPTPTTQTFTYNTTNVNNEVTTVITNMGETSVNARGQNLFALMTQQPAKFTFDSSGATSNSVQIDWHYRDIMATDASAVPVVDTSFVMLNTYPDPTSRKLRHLPFIHKLHVDLSGACDGAYASSNQKWLSAGSPWPKTLGDTESYTATTRATFAKHTGGISSAIQQILSKTDTFDIRVYGENYGLDYPDASGRSLVIESIKFKEGVAPSQPQQNDRTVAKSGAQPYGYPPLYARNAIVRGTDGDEIRFYYYNVQNEDGNASSTAKLIKATVTYSEKETFSKISDLAAEVSEPADIIDESDDSTNDIVNLDVFYTKLTGLRAGTRYDFKIQVKNDLSVTYSPWSPDINYTAGAVVQEGTYYTWLPPDTAGTTGVTGGASPSWFNVDNWAGVSGHTKISSPANAADLAGTQIIYVNKSATDVGHKKIHMGSTDERLFQISRAGINEGVITESLTGIGKKLVAEGVADPKPHITISASDTTSGTTVHQAHNFFGFESNGTPKVATATIHMSGSTAHNVWFEPVGTYGASDPHAGNNNRKGFRINGKLKFKSTVDSASQPPFTHGSYSGWDPAPTKKEITFKVERGGSNDWTNFSSLAGGTDASLTKSHDIYYDNLTGLPVITQTSTIFCIAPTLMFNMGIPSIQKFQVDMARTYSNINSEHKYLLYQNTVGVIIGRVSSISRTNRASVAAAATTDGCIVMANTAGKPTNDAVATNGQYAFTAASMHTGTGDRFKGIHFTEQIGKPAASGVANTTITIGEDAWNTNGKTSSPTPTGSDHTITWFCDYNSFNRHADGYINQSKVAASGVVLGEIHPMVTSYMNSDFSFLGGGVGFSDHTKIVHPWTMLMIDGYYQSNSMHAYPHIPSYDWALTTGAQHSVNTAGASGASKAGYEYAKRSLTITGSTVDEGSTPNNTSGYKWIIFRWNAKTDISTVGPALAGTNNHPADVNYLNLYDKFTTAGVHSKIMNKIRDADHSNLSGTNQKQQDVLCVVLAGFGQKDRFGSLTRAFRTDAKWYEQPAGETSPSTGVRSGGKSLTYFLSDATTYSKYGCMFKKSNTQWGVQIGSIPSGDSWMHVYLAVKNNVTIS